MKAQKFISTVNSLLGLSMALTPFLLFPVCDSLRPDGSHMACWYSGVLVSIMGVCIFLLSLPGKFKAIRTVLSSCCALACWFVPNKIIAIQPFGLCGVSDHACRASTMPVVGVIVILVVAVNVSSLAVNFVKGE